jgi:hypothetical protein
VIAQTYGAAASISARKILLGNVRAVLVTSYEMSPDARRFAEHLGVEARERVELKPYPLIKCNVSKSTGKKIYHLPMDQQYDTANIGNMSGELYAWTIAEAESAGFRRAFRWKGPNPS